ncbi:MAG TPA: PQQ-dependent sugar dehydrogenase, partial [Cytophagaceae bacterium]
MRAFAIVVLISISFFTFFSCQSDKQSGHVANADFDTLRFKIETLVTNITDPTAMTVAPNGEVFVTERKGNIFVYSPASNDTRKVGEINVNLGHEDGLLGIVTDPGYVNNGWVYAFYTPDPHKEQRISRFTYSNNAIDLSTEKVILSFPIVPERHQGGCLEFDNKGNLYISTGENTKPTDINGHAPIDERPGHEINDSQRSAGNTNDLRGKILRIHPNPDGTYSIPDGNLFPKGTPNTRPEIYVMGCRNPFKMAVDKLTNTLYWGEVGPDAGEDTEKGPKGYDEINRTNKAGNFGWPYFIANNKAYAEVDYSTNTVLAKYNPEAPDNNSPNNTGLKKLPSTQPAWIWYPYDDSKEFPMMGTGGRTAIAGDVYHYNAKNKQGFPQWFDKQLFIGDWMRNYVKTVSQTDDGKVAKITSFLPTHSFIRPMDMQFGNDGCLYLLEYGSNWFDNMDARLVKISYQRSNLAPIVKISGDVTSGAVPLKVNFNSKGTADLDGDELVFEWRFDEGKLIQSREENPVFIFNKPGSYRASLTVSDSKGNSSVSEIEILAGNTPPQIDISFPSHGSFYWPGDTVNYRVSVKDKEDGLLSHDQIKVKEMSFSLKAKSEAGGATNSQPYGEKLVQGSDCKACHQLTNKSVGPSFTNISQRYAGISDQKITNLANKVIHGGGGVWGPYVMSAHPQLGIEEAKEMVKYILSVSTVRKIDASLPQNGVVAIPNSSLNPAL